jgi:hypothetical protein
MHSLGRARLRAVVEIVAVVTAILFVMRLAFALLGG